MRQQLFTTSTDLIKQTNIALEEENIIHNLTQQMQTLDNSLRIAFGDIRRMHFTLESARKIQKPYESYIPETNDEIDQKMSELSNKAKLPIPFIRVSEGVYTFGSKKIQVKLVNGKLAVQAGSDFIPIEEFIRLYAQKELIKKGNKDNLQTNIEENYEEVSAVDPKENLLGRSFSSPIKDFDKSKPNQSQDISQTQEEIDRFEDNEGQTIHQNSSSFSPSRRSPKKRARMDQDSSKLERLSFEKNVKNEMSSSERGETIESNNVDSVNQTIS